MEGLRQLHTGFRLPNGSVLSPDASLIRLNRSNALSPDERRGFAPLCPDLVVELASPNDDVSRSVNALRQKMAAFKTKDGRLAWVLVPREQSVEVWTATGARQGPEQLQVLEAMPEFPRLQLQLAKFGAG